MRLRVALGRLLMRLGRFIESLPLAVLKPDDLVEFSKQRYSRAGSVEEWSDEEFLAQGLYPVEQKLMAQATITPGRVLVLGMGGGREALALARLGYEVVGVDYIAEMVAKAIEIAAQQGLIITGLVQEISQLQVQPNSFDLALMTPALYSAIPTRKNRVQILHRIGNSLKAEGYFICGFMYDAGPRSRYNWLMKTVAYLTLGNFWYENGDRLWGSEFLHAFASLAEVEAEFAEGGFTVQSFSEVRKSLDFLGALLKRSS